jgi:hypothetical protein
MKTTTLVFWALFVTIGLILAIVAIQQPVESASSTNVTLLPVSASSPARQLGDSSSGGGKVSNQDDGIAVAVHPQSAPITSMVKQQFTATVTGTTNTAVTWYVDGLLGGNKEVGWIDKKGLYVPPPNFVVGNHTVMAVSQADNTTSGSASADLVGYAGLYTNKTTPAPARTCRKRY